MHTVVRRVGLALLLYGFVITLVFVLVRAAPGDAADFLVSPNATAADAARLRAQLGLDASPFVQYARWFGGVLTGDFGMSFVENRPVTRVLLDALPVSIWLGVTSLALTFLLGIAVGAYQATRLGRPGDTVLTVVTTAVYAAPSFWLALGLVALFTAGAARWGFPDFLRLPAFGFRDPSAETRGLSAFADLVRHSVLPVTVLALIGAAGIARYTRTIMADLRGQEFARTALAKGVSRRTVVMRHVLRNAWPPLIVLAALALPGLVAGSVFVESVFAWPGMGRTMLRAIAARDYPVVMGATMVYAAAVIVANAFADALLPVVDPRRRR
ncbi:MAG TPA: ABC transporter permease [Gemmatimonadaceae bacterium]|nr:ABC transporter permease [Gemmatimonadaceae bacterium]